jgi:hypothetical protein
VWFWGFAGLSALLLFYYYARMDGEQFEILKMLEVSVVPLAVLTFTVLAALYANSRPAVLRLRKNKRVMRFRLFWPILWIHSPICILQIHPYLPFFLIF